MKTIKFNLLIINFLLLFVASMATAQELFKVSTQNSNIEVKGTSSLHDWKMTASGITAESSFIVEGNAITSIEKTRFTAPVSGLSSGKNIMDSKAHEALKEKKNPLITFQVDKAHPVNASDQKINITGQLSIAGKSKTITIPVHLNVVSQGVVQVHGEVTLKMSDFSVDPPTAMMGAVKTNDQFSVNFNLEFQKSDNALTRKF